MQTDEDSSGGLGGGASSPWIVPGRTALQAFVHHQNLALYVDQLEEERDPERRARLKMLLLEEEDRYGSRLERLDRTELLIRRGRARVTRQRILIAELEEAGRDTALARNTLANMVAVLDLFEQYGAALQDGIDRSRL